MTAATHQEIVDENGRVYRVGESPHDIMGRSRSWMVWLPWIAMMAVSVFEYGWGAVEGTLEEKYGWTLPDAFWLASIWAVFQAGVAFPAGRLQRAQRRLGEDGDAGRGRVQRHRLLHHRAQREPHAGVRRVFGLRRHRRRARVRDLHQHGRQVVPGEARRADRVRQRRLRLRLGAVHLPVQRVPRARERHRGAGRHRPVHADRRRRLRLALQGPAEELVAEGGRPGHLGARARPACRAWPRTRPRSGSSRRWRRSGPACSR